MSVVGVMGSEGVSEWAVGARRVVRVVTRSRLVGSGISRTQLLVLLLKQIMVPVVLLPLSLHDEEG